MDTWSKYGFICSVVLTILTVSGIILHHNTYGKISDLTKQTQTQHAIAADISVPIEVTPPEPPAPVVPPPPVFTYIKIHNGCDWKSEGSCVNMRSGPGTEFPSVLKLRDGMVLRVADSVVSDGLTWYKIDFKSTWIRYPERMEGDLYVAESDSVQVFTDVGDLNTATVSTTTTKRIVVDLSEQKLYAYDGAELFMEEPVSSGLETMLTPRGTFFVFRKTPSRYMQGPIPDISSQYYDLPGVPWDLYFTTDGAVIHGAYWHNKFGEQWSHGCVNLPPEVAERLYRWADIGMPVIVQS
ncbi:MAG: L,D-transpeptidase family protein [Patescibacteria group bacterium]